MSVASWSHGCLDGRNGCKMGKFYGNSLDQNAYLNGYRFGVKQTQEEEIAIAKEIAAKAKAMPDPPLKNPYMEGIEAIEGILARLQTFTKEFPQIIDKGQKDAYTLNLLEVRDELHRFRLDEMAE